LKDTVNWWNIIAKLKHDKSYWHHLEPAEIMEIVQRIKEGRKKICGLETVVKIDLRPAWGKLNRVRSHLHLIHSPHLNMHKISSY
jgi:hypothetical protein